MSKLVLYGTIGSPAVRAVLLTLHALDLEYEFKAIDVYAGETRTEEFMRMNPQHTIPLLDDDGQYIWDSHAINAYLVRKFGKTDELYPKEFYQRAVIDQRLHYDSGSLWHVMKGFVSPNLRQEEKLGMVFEAFDMLEAFLSMPYIAGDHLTIADFSILTSLTTLAACVPVDAAKMPKLFAWLQTMKQLPYYEETNGKGMEVVIAKVKEMTEAGQI